MKSPALSAAPIVAALAWTVALVVNPDPFDRVSVLLIGIGLLGMGAVAVTGMVLAGGRWAWRLGAATVSASLVIAVMRPIDIVWGFALLVSALSATALYLPGVTDRIRKLPAATGPPVRAVLLPLVLLSVPFVLGVMALSNSVATLAIGVAAPLTAFAYTRVLPGGLFVARFVWPALAIGLAPLMGLPVAVASVALGLLVGLLAWDKSVKTAFHPPLEQGSSFPIPPELAPGEILDAAQIDDKGRRK